MIVKTPNRPIRTGDIEIGSLVTIVSSKGKPQEYFVLNYRNNGDKDPKIAGLRVVPAGTEQYYAYYLYAGKTVLLNYKQGIHLYQIETVRARLAWDIVQNVIKKFDENKQKMAAQQKKAEERAKAYKRSISPKDSTNTAWGSLGNATKGYIKIYRG